MRFSFLHGADLHLDAPVHGVGRTPHARFELLRDASLDALDRIVDAALAGGDAFVVLAGDLVGGASRAPGDWPLRARRRLEAALVRLTSAGVRCVLVGGAEDPRELPLRRIEGVSVLAGSDDGEVATIDAPDGVRLATVAGLAPTITGDAVVPVAERLLRESGGPGACGLRIALLHSPSDDQLPDPARLASADVDYWALGDRHQHEVLSRPAGRDGLETALETASENESENENESTSDDAPGERGAWVVAAGTHQGRGTVHGELGAKGVVRVEVEDGAVRSVELVPVDVVRFLECRVPASEARDLADLTARLQAELARQLADSDERPSILDGVLEIGLDEDDAHDQFASAQTLRGLLADLRAHAMHSTPACWWSALRVARSTETDRAAESALEGEVSRLALAERVEESGTHDESVEALRRALQSIERTLTRAGLTTAHGDASGPAALAPLDEIGRASLLERAAHTARRTLRGARNS